MDTIFHLSERRDATPPEVDIPAAYRRQELLDLPNPSELEALRHYTLETQQGREQGTGFFVTLDGPADAGAARGEDPRWIRQGRILPYPAGARTAYSPWSGNE